MFWFFIFFVITACKNDVIYHRDYVIEGGWVKDSIVSFSFEIKDIKNKKDIFIHLKNNDEYEFSNLYFFTKMITPKGVVIRDTLEYEMTDINGKWLGSGIFGGIQNILIYKSFFSFNDVGLYNLHLQQGMRRDILKGIEEVGLRVTDSDVE
ncbi:gliding motility lipoprotein GldH [Ichthyobacterium seriolicida]|nr:gliding motility lipoprotein GldH [Ichthyobacterium seriolicida]